MHTLTGHGIHPLYIYRNNSNTSCTAKPIIPQTCNLISGTNLEAAAVYIRKHETRLRCMI